MKLLILILLLGFQSLGQAQSSSAQIDVDPEFRTTPTWYWKNSDNKCIPVPAYDVISRIGPQEIRNEFSKTPSDCQLQVLPRRVEAVLQCNAKVVEKFYAKEQLCKETQKPVASVR